MDLNNDMPVFEPTAKVNTSIDTNKTEKIPNHTFKEEKKVSLPLLNTIDNDGIRATRKKARKNFDAKNHSI